MGIDFPKWRHVQSSEATLRLDGRRFAMADVWVALFVGTHTVLIGH